MSTRCALIAGGGGFIGSHLCDRLLDLDYSVVAVDNFLTGSRENVAHLKAHKRFQLKVMDATNVDGLSQRFDLVFHLASPASPVHYIRHPLETLHSGSVVTEALLRLARRDGARFVVASTSEIYGDPLEHPQKESYWGNVSPIGPRSVYDEAKRFGEALTMAFRRSFEVDTGIVRIFNTYGPRMASDDGRVIPAFIGAALEGKPLPLHGDGLQTRSFCYVDDLVEGLLCMAFSQDQGPINIGNDSERTLLSVVQHTIKLSGSASSIEYLPRTVDDPQRRRPDLTLAREVLGWGPRVSFEEGLKATIGWFAEQFVSVGGARAGDGLYRAPENHEVAHQGPVLDVVEIETH
jgi:dTDP-glucose 4,6-dehydratase